MYVVVGLKYFFINFKKFIFYVLGILDKILFVFPDILYWCYIKLCEVIPLITLTNIIWLGKNIDVWFLGPIVDFFFSYILSGFFYITYWIVYFLIYFFIYVNYFFISLAPFLFFIGYNLLNEYYLPIFSSYVLWLKKRRSFYRNITWKYRYFLNFKWLLGFDFFITTFFILFSFYIFFGL